MSILKEELEGYDPMDAFTYALKAPESKRQYPKRLKATLDSFMSINKDRPPDTDT